MVFFVYADYTFGLLHCYSICFHYWHALRVSHEKGPSRPLAAMFVSDGIFSSTIRIKGTKSSPRLEVFRAVHLGIMQPKWYGRLGQKLLIVDYINQVITLTVVCCVQKGFLKQMKGSHDVERSQMTFEPQRVIPTDDTGLYMKVASPQDEL